MKTVIDAVNEFKAIWENGKSYVYVGSSSNGQNRDVLQLTYDAVANNQWLFVCHESEFNRCVDEMSINFGTSETYSDYKANYEMINDDMKPVTPTYTQEMKDAGTFPSVGMKCLTTNNPNKNIYIYQGLSINGKAILESIHTFDIIKVPTDTLYAIDTRTDTEKCGDDLDKLGYLSNVSLINSIKAGKVHGVTFTGES